MRKKEAAPLEFGGIRGGCGQVHVDEGELLFLLILFNICVLRELGMYLLGRTRAGGNSQSWMESEAVQ